MVNRDAANDEIGDFSANGSLHHPNHHATHIPKTVTPSPKVWTSNRFTEEGPDFEKKEKILKKVRTREEKTNAELACKLSKTKTKG